MHNWLERYHGKCSRALLEALIEGLPSLDRHGLVQYRAGLLQEWNSKPAMTYMHLKEFLELQLGATCSKNTMMHFMQSPFLSMEIVSIDVLRGDDYINF